jgi:hypothetical protein
VESPQNFHRQPESTAETKNAALAQLSRRPPDMTEMTGFANYAGSNGPSGA